jgi:hypothetical protein
MPPVNVALLDGQLAWRQHDGGHTDAPNWRYFIPWADRFLKHKSSITNHQSMNHQSANRESPIGNPSSGNQGSGNQWIGESSSR